MKTSFLLFGVATCATEARKLRGVVRRLQPELVIYGNNGDFSVYPLPLCGGECDTDTDCEGDLVCFQRNRGDPVPGCSGNDFTSRGDYCIEPPMELPAATDSPTPVNSLPAETVAATDPATEDPTETFVPSGTVNPSLVMAAELAPIVVTETFTTMPEVVADEPVLFTFGNPSGGVGIIPLCGGDCDTDEQCEEGLVCFLRNDDTPVPGCPGKEDRSGVLGNFSASHGAGSVFLKT